MGNILMARALQKILKSGHCKIFLELLHNGPLHIYGIMIILSFKTGLSANDFTCTDENLGSSECSPLQRDTFYVICELVEEKTRYEVLRVRGVV